MAINPDKLDASMGMAVGDIVSARDDRTVFLNDKLGPWKAMV